MGFTEAIPILVQDELESAGPAVSARAAALSDQLTSLQNYIQANIPETWTGRSSHGYQHYQQLWHTAAHGLFDPQDGVLGQIASALNVIWLNYAASETANTVTWQHS